MDLPFQTTTPMRAADTNTRPSFEMPPGACDTHFHVFEPGFPVVGKPQYTFPEATIDQYLSLAEVLGIDRMVLVQPTYYGEDNTLLLHALSRLGERARGVVRVPDDVTPATLEDYDAHGVRAIRLDLFTRREWTDDRLLGYVHHMAALAQPLGWHLQFYAPGSVVHSMLPRLADLPVPYVVDHMGYIKQSDGLGAAGTDGLLNAMNTGNCWIKLSGAYRVAANSPLSSVAPLGRALVAARPDRLVWGSDWPHLPDGQRDTGEVLNLLADWAPHPRDRATVLVDGPDTLFFAH